MNDTVHLNTCPNCGGAIPEGAPQGLCPKCALRLAATTEPGFSPPATDEIPSLERVAAAFPQLEIVELLGRGGMGFVFKARQPHLDRFVALKLLPERFARDPHFAERFTREARILARLNHPGIVSIYDFGQAGGFYFLLMEYVDGVNLYQAMRAGKFSPEAALGIVPRICEALQFAHEHGVLHRDIKPANILLDTRGRVKIADFGIAKLVGDQKPDLHLTATGAAIGTPQYMAPEQLEQPASVDHRADIFSLGVVFYEMLTGELPLGRFAPPSQRTPLDPRVDQVVMRALEKEREKRYQSAGEVKTTVESLTQTQVVSGAAAPAFDPAQDFILCPPRLPRMAKAIIVYALVVAPVLWFVGLFTYEPLPEHALVAFVTGAVNFLTITGEFLVLIALAVGGWKLRALRPSAQTWLRFSLWFHLGLIVLVVGANIWVEVLAADLLPNSPATSLDVSDGSMLAIGLASLVFEISALVWLRRNSTTLKALCPPPAPGQGPHGTAVLKAAAPGARKWSRASIIGAVLSGLSIPLPVLLLMLMVAGMGALGPGEILLLMVAAGLFGVPGAILGWIGWSDIRAHRQQMRGLPLAVFATLAWPLLLLIVGTLLLPRWSQTPTQLHSSAVSAPSVSMEVMAPPRETLIVTGIVISNGVPLPGESLRTKLWPPSGSKPGAFTVQWKIAENANPDVPWEIVIADATSKTIAARLRPPNLPQLAWSVSPSASNLGRLSVTREARTFEVARALQTSGGGNAGAADWSVRIQLQSSPHSATSSRGIKADFVLPANQVAVFELVTRSNGVMVPVPELAAYHVNAAPESYTGKFILADDPDDLDSLSGLPRWTFGIIGPDGRLASQGLAVPPIPPDFNLTLQVWKVLQPDQEVLDGLSESGSGTQPYGLRIRTHAVHLKPGLRHSSSGYGTNWMAAVAPHRESATTNPGPRISFTFTAIELREVDGKRWLALDYLDNVQGDCEKSFPWETRIPGFRAEVRTSEYASQDPANPVRHQRIEYLLPDSMSRFQLEELRRSVESALKQKTIRLELGQERTLFEFGSSSATAFKALLKVIPPPKI
jgi:predicted Ser/Thr protein kinase